jgi:hypothetical protein
VGERLARGVHLEDLLKHSSVGIRPRDVQPDLAGDATPGERGPVSNFSVDKKSGAASTLLSLELTIFPVAFPQRLSRRECVDVDLRA